MCRFVFLLLTIYSTVFLLNYKFSQAIRILAFNEQEPKGEAVMAFILLFVVSVLWSVWFCFF